MKTANLVFLILGVVMLAESLTLTKFLNTSEAGDAEDEGFTPRWYHRLVLRHSVSLSSFGTRLSFIGDFQNTVLLSVHIFGTRLYLQLERGRSRFYDNCL
jgi:hypothetical protein